MPTKSFARADTTTTTIQVHPINIYGYPNFIVALLSEPQKYVGKPKSQARRLRWQRNDDDNNDNDDEDDDDDNDNDDDDEKTTAILKQFA